MFWKRRRSHNDFRAEIQSHIDIETDRLIAEGFSPAEARSAACRRFGNVTTTQERFYESHRTALWLDDLLRDLRHALRSLWRTPVFTVVALLTLAMGIGEHGHLLDRERGGAATSALSQAGAVDAPGHAISGNSTIPCIDTGVHGVPRDEPVVFRRRGVHGR